MDFPNPSGPDEDLSNINLLFSESVLLFRYSFKPYFDGDRFGRHLDPLFRSGFIVENYGHTEDRKGRPIPEGTFTVSDKYFRYRAYWRNTVLKGSVWPAIVSFIVSVIANRWL